MDYLEKVCNEVFGANEALPSDYMEERILVVPHNPKIIPNHMYFVETLRTWLKDSKLRKVRLYTENDKLCMKFEIIPDSKINNSKL